MGRYAQLSLEDRCEIARLCAEGRSIRQIAAALDRAPSTISRELKRNRGRQVGYKPSYAQEQAKARRWVGSRLDREPTLRSAVQERLAKGWSPEQVAGRLAREAGRKVISHESIYRFIYAQIARKKDYRWRHYLPRAKSKRGFRGRRGGSAARLIEGRVSVGESPPDATHRAPGPRPPSPGPLPPPPPLPRPTPPRPRAGLSPPATPTCIASPSRPSSV